MSKDLIKPINRSQFITKSFYGDKITVYKNDLDKLEAKYIEAIDYIYSLAKGTFDYLMSDDMETFEDEPTTMNDKLIRLESSEFPEMEKIIEKAYGKSWENIKYDE
jgi:hypothetical protein